MTATMEHPLILKVNQRIAKYQAEVENLQRPMTQSPTQKRLGEYNRRVADGERLKITIRALEGWRDALATDALPAGLLGAGTLGNETLDWFVHREGWPTGQWNKGLASALQRAGITEGTYADKRAEFLALAAPPDVDGQRHVEIQRRQAAILPGSVKGFFPTPPAVVQRMLEYAQIREDDLILEPSAGTGVILDAIRQHWADAVELYCCEINHTLRDLLEMKGYRFAERIGSDFLNGGPYDQDPRFDVIVGNPPFEDGQDRQHIVRAYQWLAPGGRLVMICSEGPFFRMAKADVQFRLWLAEHGAETERLPADAFKPSGTSVTTRLVIMYK